VPEDTPSHLTRVPLQFSFATAFHPRAKETIVSPKKRHMTLLQRLRQVRPDVVAPEVLIRRGRVFVEGIPVVNPRALIPEGKTVAVHDPEPLRGQLKLGVALEVFHVEVGGAVALDAGAAAGGFTQTLLDAGAQRVYAVDVGHGQLRGWLRQDPRVVVLERTNISLLDTSFVPGLLNVITLDLSYASIAEAVPQLDRLDIADGADLLALVKPMFELGLPALPSAEKHKAAVEHAAWGVEDAGWRVMAVTRSPVIGGRGAVEFWLHAKRIVT
jgi:23S rRNA (cytidine1920-2'-O)/16S rRNA (cytidine1409-2'-O)-methyltransferase